MFDVNCFCAIRRFSFCFVLFLVQTSFEASFISIGGLTKSEIKKEEKNHIIYCIF